MKCKKCGSENVEGAKFCSNCGEKLSEEIVVDFEWFRNSLSEANKLYNEAKIMTDEQLQTKKEEYEKEFDDNFNKSDELIAIYRVLEERGIKCSKLLKKFFNEFGEDRYGLFYKDKNSGKDMYYVPLPEDKVLKVINELVSENRPNDAIKLFEIAEECDNACLMNFYAKRLHDANGGLGKIDDKKAYELLLKSSKLGNTEAKRYLAVFYLNGTYVNKDNNMYEKLAKECMEKGDYIAKRGYAQCLIEGTAGKIDKQLGEKYLIECVNNNHDGMSADMLGVYYFKGILGDCINYEKAKQAFEIAVKYGDPEAPNHLQVVEEQLSLNKDMKKHLFWRK